MKLTDVYLYSDYSTNPIVLSFRDKTYQNPYQVKNILGLDADDIIRRFDRSGYAGRKFYDYSLRKREVVVHVGLNPDWSENATYSELRDELYRMISASRMGDITVEFRNGNTRVASIKGQVKKFEASHFSKTPEAQITLDCQDPMLRGISRVTAPVVGQPTNQTWVTDALSTAPHGFKFRTTLTASSPNFIIADEGGGQNTWALEIRPISPINGFVAGDELTISSEHTGKSVVVKRGAGSYNIADAVVFGSSWPTLFPGPNKIVMAAAGAPIWNEMSYIPAYWGV